MAQKRTDYSKFTQSNGTIQVLMLWASIALHFLIGSNLGLFGRLEPIKVKPAGGTVRVVDLTPAEQTRVPEAAKSKPLPIAPTPVNPEVATRTPNNSLPSGGSRFADLVPPRNQPQPPQITPTPAKPPIQTNPNSKKLVDPGRQQSSPLNGSDLGGIKPNNSEGSRKKNKPVESGDQRSENQESDDNELTKEEQQRLAKEAEKEQQRLAEAAEKEQQRLAKEAEKEQQRLAEASKEKRKKEKLAIIKKDFDVNVDKLNTLVSRKGLTEKIYTRLPPASYLENRTCDSQSDGYVFVAILLDRNGKSFADNDFELSYLGPLSAVLKNSDSLNISAGNVLGDAEKSAKLKYSSLSPAKQKENQDKKINTIHVFEAVYSAKTCKK